MKHFITLLIIAISITSCSKKDLEDITTEEVFTMKITYPDIVKREHINKETSTININTSWEEKDSVHLFVKQNEKVLDLGKKEIINKKANIADVRLKLDKTQIDKNQDFNIYAIYKAEAKLSENKVIATGQHIVCEDIHKIKAPLFYSGVVRRSTKPEYRHHISLSQFGIYEVTHITNNSDKAITFSSVIWQDAEQEQHAIEAGTTQLDTSAREWSIPNFQFDLTDNKVYATQSNTDISFREITIEKGETKSFVTWTMMSDKKMLPNAISLKASIKEGQTSKQIHTRPYTKNKKKTLEEGNSYNIYAVWDGEELLFADTSEQIKIDITSLELTEGESAEVPITRGRAVRTESTNEEIALTTIEDDGKKIKVQAKSKGSSTITIFAEDTSVKLNITVKEAKTQEPDPGNNGENQNEQPQEEEKEDYSPQARANQTWWMKGVNENAPKPSEWKSVFAHVTGLKWSNSYGWYDLNKATPYVGGPSNVDSDLCWAAVSANILQWWLDQNKDYIERFGYKGPNKFTDSYTSDIFELYKKHFPNKGNDLKASIDWFFNGKFGQEDKPGAGFFKEVFGENFKPMVQIGAYSNEFSDQIAKSLKSEEGICCTVQYPNGYLHAISIWGADFDDKGKVTHIYLTDSNDKQFEDENQIENSKQTKAGLLRRAISLSNDGNVFHEGSVKGSYKYRIIYLFKLGLSRDKWKKHFDNK